MSYDIQRAENFVQNLLTTSNRETTLVAIEEKNLFPAKWSGLRKLIGYLQLHLNEKSNTSNKLVVDGYYGEMTNYWFETYLEFLAHGKIKAWRSDAKPDRQIKTLYPDYKGLSAFYGPLSDISKEIVTVTVPYTHYLAWNNQKVNKVSCHRKVKDAYLSVLEEVKKVYGEKNIHRLHLDQFGGAFVNPPRTMRGGNNYSTHCWGIAFDYDPEHNQLKWGRDRAAFATPDYDDWMKAWVAVDAVNLGEIKNYDWMHFQFSRP